MILALSCNPGRPGNSGSSGTPSPPVVTPTSAGSFVQVDFEGLIAHVVPDTGAAKPRAVVLADDKIHLHAFLIEIPPINEAESELDFIGADHPCVPFAGCSITSINNGIALTIEGLAPGLTKSTSFKTFVPSLSDAFGTAIPEASLNADLKNPTPTSGDFLAYFDYTGGTLSAVPYCGLGAFKNTGTPRRFVDVVTLIGETTSPAQLKVTNAAGVTKTFTFKDPDYIRILLRNMPINPAAMSDHFPIYAKLFASSAGVKLPEVDHSLACPPKGTVVGCSDSTWP
ncbi:MAG TPA: hypothetical protein VNN25_20865 [Thermoanaerobaculia bacterium]|nr:hypothetical protein [Thermoanaerobaculia bacterium]